MNRPDYNEARKRTKEMVQIRNFTLEDKYKKIGQGKKFFLKTYGCQMNEHDSENIKGMLNEMSFTETLDMEDADLILLNTCSIRENAHNKAFGLLGRIKHLKETKPSIVAGICGCMAQEEGVIKEILAKYRFLNFVFGTHNLDELPTLVEKGFEGSKLNIDVKSIEGDIIEDIPFTRDSKYKAYINIIYGCDKFCTYCIVPYTRGKQRSRKKEDILKEVKELIKNGYQEITLLGQNVNAYGKDLYDNYFLADLLKDISKLNIPRIRFITSHPWDFTDDLVEVIKNNQNILNYVHLPVQSGSNKILKLMGRRYTKESYKELLDKLKTIPNISITTDIIVGFPGETEEDFQDTLDMVKYSKYDSAYTFIYSPRENTPASKLEDNVSLEEKEQRLYRLNDLVNKYSKEANLKMLNKIENVLVDGLSDKEGKLCGYTETNKLVNFKGDTSLIGKIVPVKITDAKSFSLDGEIVE
ncbi:MAG: tRNA (N6-isopentenyl adenosine(37)-C2)-methylthiotransferase MiaB [Erysipelotrichaceae bacterium]|nr:tRNA (N6-isopentenyl adenosine(37)-C2)-methylthiotransferase MiaB [Erysipelotrichaceae bacterium]